MVVLISGRNNDSFPPYLERLGILHNTGDYYILPKDIVVSCIIVRVRELHALCFKRDIWGSGFPSIWQAQKLRDKVKDIFNYEL